MTIDFYYRLGCPFSGASLLTAKALGLQLNMKKMDWTSEDNVKPWFIKMNPLHTVPTIMDDGFALAESRAIMVYLVTKYGKDDTLYPNDAKKRGLVEQRLSFGLGTLEKRFWDIYTPALDGEPIDQDKIPKLKEALEILDLFMSQSKWSAGDHITIADHSLAGTIGAFDAVGFDLTPYKNVTNWYKQCQDNMTGYKEANQDGVDYFKEYARSVLGDKHVM